MLGGALRGTVTVPGDKSISHRAAIVAAMARGTSTIEGYSPAGDCASTLRALSALGVRCWHSGGALRVQGLGLEGFSPPGDEEAVDCGRSGATMRMLAGVLAGIPARTVLTGDPQLLRRPMARVADPLRRMGAEVETDCEGRPPLTVRGGGLRGIEYRLPVASAQVKSAVLLAGLSAEGTTTVVEEIPTRDHTERLLWFAGVDVEVGGDAGDVRSSVRTGAPEPFTLRVPGDLSSAAPMLAAAALVPGSNVAVAGVGLNPTRTGFLDLLRRMGADVEVHEDDVATEPGPEPAGEIRVRHSALAGVRLGHADVPSLIDELPLVALLGTQAQGTTEVRGAAELRVKESDRIAGLIRGLRALGADAEELPDGFVVRGPKRLTGGSCDAQGDHRLAMAFTVAGLVAAGPVEVTGMTFVADSFPGFVDTLEALR
jgi:3-phosphoshikimate 1-carboxyvinyltransferase